SQETLALYAGRDLGLLKGWRVRRHLGQCDRCRDEIAAYETVREISSDLAEIPEVQWNRLAAEMKANIRLGLAAGECVRTSDPPLRATPLFTGARAIVALASIAALSVTGVMLERPAPVIADEGVFVQATPDGVQIRKGAEAFQLMHDLVGSGRVTYSSD